MEEKYGIGMKLMLMSLFLVVCSSVFSQTLKKYPIGKSGCSLYTYCDSKYKLDYSDDSSAVYTGECVTGSVTYGVICVKIANPIDDLDVAQDLMISYIDYLKSNFQIVKAAGYGNGHRLKNNEQTRGVIDYWEDQDNDKWKIKSWTDGHYIGFMYVYSAKELPVARVDAFLDSFRLPGM